MFKYLYPIATLIISYILVLVFGIALGGNYMRDDVVIYCNENPAICQQEYKITKSKYPDLKISVDTSTIGQQKPILKMDVIANK
jgi:hypothetical protein